MTSLLATLLVSTFAQAQLPPPKIIVRAQVADKVSQFIVSGDGPNMNLYFHNTDGITKKRAFKEDEFKFLLKEIDKLPVAPKVPAECSRFRTDITVIREGKKEPLKKSSCLSVRSITEPAYAKLLNLLAISL